MSAEVFYIGNGKKEWIDKVDSVNVNYDGFQYVKEHKAKIEPLDKRGFIEILVKDNNKTLVNTICYLKECIEGRWNEC